MFLSGLVLGYHGCSTKTAANVLRHQIHHLNLSKSSQEWLGDGVYFWENSYDRAMQWALEHIADDEKPAVIGAIIIPGNCLDLTDSQSIRELKPVAILMEEFWPRLHPDEKFPENKGMNHSYDCALLNFYHYFLELSEQDKINTIRAPFQEGSPIAGHGCSFRDKNHIQWAVRTPADSILGYFVPRGNGTEQPELLKMLTSSYQ